MQQSGAFGADKKTEFEAWAKEHEPALSLATDLSGNYKFYPAQMAFRLWLHLNGGSK